MKNLHKELRKKNLTTKEKISKFLIGKTVRIINKQNPNNYGEIGSTFVVEKIDNISFDNNPHAQLKDYCNKIYFEDLELYKPNKAKKILDTIHDICLTSSEQFNLVQNIFKY